MTREVSRVALSSLFGKLPPAAVESEIACLGCMILDAGVIPDVAAIISGSQDFTVLKHRHVYEALIDLHNSKNSGDINMLCQLMRDRATLDDVGGPEFLVELAEGVPASTNFRHYANEVADKAFIRRMIGALGEGLETCYTASENAAEIADTIDKLVFAATERRGTRRTKNIGQIVADCVSRFKMRKAGEMDGISSGFIKLDTLLCGFHPAESIVLAARPGMGKSALAANFAVHAAEWGAPVQIFSLEMSAEQIGDRWTAEFSGVPMNLLRDPRFCPAEKTKELDNAARVASELPIYVNDDPSLTLMTMRAEARRVVKEHGVRMLVIDYMQLMGGAEQEETREREVSMISRTIKRLSKELNVPIISLAQLNRRVEERPDKKPMLSDLRESGSIEQDADVVLLLHRPDYYGRNDPNYVKDNKGYLEVAKQRNGPTDTVDLTWNEKLMTFTNHVPEY